MKKFYFIIPFIGILIMIGVHIKYQSTFEKDEADKKAHVEDLRQKKVQADVEARRKAAQDAVEQQELRKKAKALKDAQEAAQKDQRIALQDAREKSYRERDKNSKTVDRLKSDISVEKEAVDKVEKQKKAATEEEAFQRNYVKQAETNRTSLEDVLKKIQAADDAIAAAQARAAEEAKKKPSS